MAARLTQAVLALSLTALAGCLPETLDKPVHLEDDTATADVGTDTGGKKTDGGTQADTADPDTGTKVDGPCKVDGDCSPQQCGFVYCDTGEKKCKIKQFKEAGKACDDGDQCNGGVDECDGNGKCEGTIKDVKLACVADGNPCKQAKCSGKKCVVTFKTKGSNCDDGIKCTQASQCDEKGECTGGEFTCGCLPNHFLWFDKAKKKKKDSPYWKMQDMPEDVTKVTCPDWENDDDKCLGERYCDTSGDFWLCKTKSFTNKYKNPCPKSANECVNNKCDPKTGQCTVTFIPETQAKSCEDNNPCTLPGNSLCNGKGECASDPLANLCECTPFNYKEKCKHLTGKDLCKGTYCDTTGPATAWKCKLNKATTVKCSTNKDDACVHNVCDPAKGICELVSKSKKDGTQQCDDGQSCTANDFCTKGVCVGETNICKCSKDADCAKHDDGDRCNGTMFCEKKTGDCILNKATEIKCASSKNTQCVENFCYQSTGECKMTPAENILTTKIFPNEAAASKGQKPYFLRRAFPYRVVDFLSCEDGAACTVNDNCANGTCKSGNTNICACAKDSDCVDDGDFCNGKPYCDKLNGSCKINPASLKVCSTLNDTVCAKSECEKKTGNCKLTAVKEKDTLCSDGDPCTKSDTCKNGKCVAGTNTCSCAKDSDCKDKGSGDACEGTLYCDKGGGADFTCRINPATVVKCKTGNDTQCLKNTCNKKSGTCSLQPANEFVFCDDGDPCTASPVCVQGTCYSETNLCDCATKADCAKFEDGKNLCSPKYDCIFDQASKLKKCLPVTKPKCLGSAEQCSTFECDPKTGECATKPRSPFNDCDDDNPCTVGDNCDGKGSCSSGGNICQCKTDADCAKYDDKNACNGTAICDKASGTNTCIAKPGSVVVCASQHPKASCLINVCDPADGKCKDTTKPGACPDDGDPCTLQRCQTGDKTGTCETVAAPDGTPAGTAISGHPLVCRKGKPVKGPKGMRYVPPGVFMMGCSDNPAPGPLPGDVQAAAAEGTACKGSSNEKPQHQVTMSAFWIDELEVSVEEFHACVTAGACKAPDKKLDKCMYNRWLFRKDDPGLDKESKEASSAASMTCIDYKSAQAYCAWTAKKDVLPNAGGGDLPTEAQWEYAARGSCATVASKNCGAALRVYPWGLQPQVPDCDSAWVKRAVQGLPCASTETQAVGGRIKDRSVFGLYDVVGNAREWVRDGYDAKFYASANATKKNPFNAAGADAVLRGGAFNKAGIEGRLTARYKLAKSTGAAEWVGFRCARVLVTTP